MVAEILEFIVEALGALGSKIKKGRKKVDENESEITCPLCNKRKLTINLYCPSCETHVIMEKDTIEKKENFTKIKCQSCGFVQDSSQSDDFCDKCGDLLIN